MTVLRGAKVLITQAHLVRFMGSEMVTLELAEYLAGEGADVVIATHTFGGPIRAEFDALPVRVFELTDERLDDDFRGRMPDIAWVQHSIIPESLLQSPENTTFFFNHMSAQTAAEFSLSPEIERQFATAILFVSPEAKTAHLAAGSYEGIPDHRLQIWANPSPPRFSEVAPRPSGTKPRIAVVSNHLAAELLSAVETMCDAADISLIGAESQHGAVPRRITPEALAEFDAVVSIGKTVQYALTAGVPAYCYDHFGGPGWISEANLESAAETNFSGRGSSRKTSEEIAREVIDGFPAARVDATRLVESSRMLYSLPVRMSALLAYSAANRVLAQPPSPATAANLLTMQATLGSYIREWIREWGNAAHRAAVIESMSRMARLVDQTAKWTGLKRAKRVLRWVRERLTHGSE